MCIMNDQRQKISNALNLGAGGKEGPSSFGFPNPENIPHKQICAKYVPIQTAGGGGVWTVLSPLGGKSNIPITVSHQTVPELNFQFKLIFVLYHIVH